MGKLVGRIDATEIGKEKDSQFGKVINSSIMDQEHHNHHFGMIGNQGEIEKGIKTTENETEKENEEINLRHFTLISTMRTPLSMKSMNSFAKNLYCISKKSPLSF